MPDDRSSPPDAPGAAPPTARVAAAGRRAAARQAAEVADLAVGARDRLDDDTRSAASLLLEREVATIARDLAARIGAAAIPDIAARLSEAGVMQDAGLAAEAIAQARLLVLNARLAAAAPPARGATLLARLAEAGDPGVRARASDYLVADNRWRQAGGELPPRQVRRIAWWVAAALRDHVGDAADAALVAAVERVLARRRERGEAAEAALHLSAAIDASAEDLAFLLPEALDDGRLDLFVALLAHALGFDGDEMRALAIDPDGERLWLALRAAGLPRPAVARVGWALCRADRRRDVEALPDHIDALDAVTPDAASRALGVSSLAGEYRAAIRRLEERT